MVEREGGWRAVVVSKCRQVTSVFRAVKPQFADQRQRLGHELARGVPLMSVSRGEAEEVAGRGIVERLGLLQLPLATAGEQRNLTTFLNQDDSSGEQVGAVLGLEVLSRAARKRRNQGADHASQQTEELRLDAVLTVRKRLAEGRLVGKRREGVDISEEVVDKELQDGHRSNRLGIENAVGGDGHERLGCCLGRGRHVEHGTSSRRNSVLDASTLRCLCGLGMLVRGTTTLRLAIVCTLDTQLAAGTAGNVGIVALDLAHAAHITGASQACQLRVDGRISHHAVRTGDKVARHVVRRGRQAALVGRVMDGLRGRNGSGSMLKGLGILDRVGGIAGGLEYLEPVTGVGMGGRVGRRRGRR